MSTNSLLCFPSCGMRAHVLSCWLHFSTELICCNTHILISKIKLVLSDERKDLDDSFSRNSEFVFRSWLMFRTLSTPLKNCVEYLCVFTFYPKNWLEMGVFPFEAFLPHHSNTSLLRSLRWALPSEFMSQNIYCAPRNSGYVHRPLLFMSQWPTHLLEWH